MGRVQNIEYDSVTCDHRCGAKAEVTPDGIPPGTWRFGELDGCRYDACGETCAGAIVDRLADESDEERRITWWMANGTRIDVRVRARKDS